MTVNRRALMTWLGQATLLCLLPETAKADPLTANTYRTLAKEVGVNLERHVLSQWFPRSLDTKIGGFHQNYDEQWQATPGTERNLVYQSRLTWMAAETALALPQRRIEFLRYARHGTDFLVQKLWDKDNGGFFWEVHNDGTIFPEKHVYGISFAIYALSTAYKATRDTTALRYARLGFDWLEKHAHDAKNRGYYEALARNGKPILKGPGLSGQEKDLIGTSYGLKSMNTHIHLLEAFTVLSAVTPDARIRKRLNEVFLLVRDVITVPPGFMHLYFRPDWTAVPEFDSFGHDVETAYLLWEAAEQSRRSDRKRTETVCRSLVDHALKYGWDNERGGFYYEGKPSAEITNPAKDWWTQAEGLNALLLMHELYGKATPRYFEAFQKQWEFIQKYQIDAKNGGWHSTVAGDGTVPSGQAKSHAWKEPYHQGRALLNVHATLNRLAKHAAK